MNEESPRSTTCPGLKAIKTETTLEIHAGVVFLFSTILAKTKLNIIVKADNNNESLANSTENKDIKFTGENLYKLSYVLVELDHHSWESTKTRTVCTETR